MSSLSTSAFRPEDRRRDRREAADAPDLLPLCHRSEAFAEDLTEPEPPAPGRRGARHNRRLGPGGPARQESSWRWRFGGAWWGWQAGWR